jgi:diguanylate cyclase (GGDEF)-like protein
MGFLFRFLFLLAYAAAAGATTLPLVDSVTKYSLAPYVEVLEDHSGTLTFDDVSKSDAPFMPAGAHQDLSYGYRASVYWLRLTIAPPPGGTHESWVFEVAYPTLDSVTLYQPSHGAYWSDETGDLLPFSSRPVDHRNFVFPMRLSGAEPQTVYLRVQSQGTITIPFTLWQADAFARASELAYAGLALYFGAFIAIALYNLLLYVSLRDRLLLIYVCFVASLAVGLGSQYGLTYQFLWPGIPRFGNIMFPAGMSLAGVCGIYFTRHFLNTPVTLPRSDKMLRVLTVLFAAVLPLLLIRYRWASLLISVVAVLFCVMALEVGIRSVYRRYYGAVFYLLAWTLFLIFTTFMSLRNMGLLPSNFLTLNGMQIGSAAEMILLSFALADRYRKVYREREQAREEALEAKQQVLETMRTHERMLEQRVTERTAELQRTNRKLQESQQQLQSLAHHDPLTGLANRLLLDTRLEHALKTAARQGSNVAILLLDVDDFKPVNDHYGHAVGDELLVELARRMESVVRQTDTVARLGGDEFIILLESISGPEAVKPIVEKLIAAIQLPVQTQVGVAVQVGVSIGYTVAGPGEMDRTTLINRADQAMYAAKNSGGNRASIGTA